MVIAAALFGVPFAAVFDRVDLAFWSLGLSLLALAFDGCIFAPDEEGELDDISFRKQVAAISASIPRQRNERPESDGLMRILLSAWFAPITFLVLWLLMASNDWSLGIHFFSRDMYDSVFDLYANVLGVPAETLPPLVVRALVLDSLIVLALYAFAGAGRS